jgi:hypothetical protein
LGQIENTFALSTALKWYSELISDKYNSTGENQKKRGRKPIKDEIVAEVLRLAENNPNIFLPFRNVFPLSQSGSQSGGITDKFKQYCNNPIAKNAIRINVITPARDSYSTTSRNTLHGANLAE